MAKGKVGKTVESLGDYLKDQRVAARLSLRQLADQAGVSNPYLSQIERGLHEPSVRVLRSIARALNVSAETLLSQAGLLENEEAGAHVRDKRGDDREGEARKVIPGKESE